ncbi:MAG TPA: DUF3299 domain-containing protein [Planctomycetes bacterium]|nr:DUF3299 domain-containing protein [Planctomycetota bacterium]HIK61936.1 DUF3299 domain-containing protein [Planctomycetota bacterium]
MDRSYSAGIGLALIMALAACGAAAGDAPGDNVTAPSTDLVVERGLPLDAPVLEEPEAVSGTPSGAIDAVAAGLDGVDASGLGKIDSSRTSDVVDGVAAISWADLSMQDIAMEDILDSLLYPEEYKEGEFEFPDRIKRNDGEVVSIVGYMIPLEWKETTVPEFMLVRDLLGCCFGGSPQPDEWINVIMEGKGAEYFPYIPVIVTGTFKIEGIEDEAGYAAGCFHLSGTSVTKEL